MAATPKYFLGGTYRFRNTFTLDGAVWNLAGGTVTVTWVKPGGTQLAAASATAVGTGSGGQFYYDVTTSFFDTVGGWKLYWKATDASSVIGYDGPYVIPVSKITTDTSDLTAVSSDKPYAMPSDLLNAHRWEDIGNWASTNGTTVTQEAILTDPVVYAALLRGAGEIEMACFCGERYSPLALASLTGASQAALIGLNADLGAYHLAKRILPDPTKINGFVAAQQMLKDLREGLLIFGFQETATAGVMSTVDLKYDSQSLPARITEQAQRLFGRRMDRRQP